MFLKNLGAGSGKSVGNLMSLFSPAASCYGDNEDKAVACRHMAVIDVSSVTTVASIRIEGVTHSFDATWATTTEAGRAGIISEIVKIMNGLGYRDGGCLWVTPGGTLWALHFDFSTLTPEWLGASGNEFIPVACFVVGHKTSTDVEFSIFIKELANGTYDCTIKIYGGTSISAFAVTYDSVSKTTAVPTGNSYTFNMAEADAEAEKALIVAITPTGGSIVSRTITATFANYAS